jgi:valyl-tRNA synthetase
MIFTGLEFMKEVPFKKVMIHGLVLDSQGRKMSKSLGNGVDPIEVIDQYGADTLRFMLITGNTPGNDLRFHPERLEATRNFANKIWNASRFVLLNLQDYEEAPRGELLLADHWILSRYEATIQAVTEALDRFDLGEAARLLYEFIWNEFCDWYIELAKGRLYDKEHPEARSTVQSVLLEVLEGTMRLLHPYMPFLTEEIWQNLPMNGESIMMQSWPQVSGYRNDSVEKQMNLIMEVVKAVRNIRAEMNVQPGKKAEIILVAPETENREVLEMGKESIRHLAGGSQVDVVSSLEVKPAQAASAVLDGVEVYLPLRGLLDLDKEIARVEKEIAQALQEQSRLEGKLNNPGFVAKAPEQVVAKEREKLEGIYARISTLKARIEELKEA